MSAGAYVDAVLRGIDDSAARTGVEVRLLLSINRGEPRSVPRLLACSSSRHLTRSMPSDAGMRTVRLAKSLRDAGTCVVGVDFSGNPHSGSFANFASQMSYARKAGLYTTVHCGEVVDPADTQSVLQFWPDRVGHACVLDDRSRQLLRSRQIPVETCPTSNMKTCGFASPWQHPELADWLRGQHPVAVCTDDSTVFHTTLSQEYVLLARAFGLSLPQLVTLARAPLDMAFVDHSVRARLRQQFDRAVQTLLPLATVGARTHRTAASSAAPLVGQLGEAGAGEAWWARAV